jgi:ABC-type uncharacterized transport system permease subunit
MIKQHVTQATDYAYWTGMAIGLAAGACLGVLHRPVEIALQSGRYMTYFSARSIHAVFS